MDATVEIITCDFDNPQHCYALIKLMNEYITDAMGEGLPHTSEQKKLLVQGLKSHPSKIIKLAIANGEFIGLINCFINFATFTVRPFVNIHDVIVTQAWRNEGIGRKLLESVIEESRKIGCSKVTLEVREDNHNAKYLYNSMGFLDATPRQFYLTKVL